MMRKRLLFVGFLLVFAPTLARAAGPYAPKVGQTGSTALHKDDPCFVGWATGWENYVVGAKCDSGWQTPNLALGKAVGGSYDIVCLGDAGQITLTFDGLIYDGPGADFAVFENSFNDTFLELAYVEVSSNGTDYFRFDNDSLTAVKTSSTVDPTNIDGLAGKYRQGYGTPFDLADLEGVSALLDIDCVGYVRLVDIVGDGTYLDTSGNPIYDVYPTSGSAGFDLDAVGVIHSVPEPSGLLLSALGMASVALIRGRRGRESR